MARAFFLRAAATCLVTALFAWTVFGQALSNGKFSNYTVPSVDPNGKRSTLKGAEAQFVGDGLLRLVEPRVQTFKTNGDPDMLIEASLCFYDRTREIAFSPERLTVTALGGKFRITGLGFQWSPKTSTLMISNAVDATVAPELLRTNLANANGAATTNAPLHIKSERFLAAPGRAEFIENAIAQQPNSIFRADDRVIVRFLGEATQIQRIDGNGNVFVQREDLQLRGDQAQYDIAAVDEEIKVIGNATWIKGPRKGAAALINYYPERSFVSAQGGAELEAPIFRGTHKTNAPIAQIQAELLQLQMAVTNGPSQTLDAATNVVITIPAEKSVARAQRAHFAEVDGVLRLDGDPNWVTPQWELAGDSILISEKEENVRAFPNARLKVAADTIGLQKLFASTNASDPNLSTNWFVISTGDHLFYSREQMLLTTNVVTKVYQAATERGWSESQSALIRFRPAPEADKKAAALPGLEAGSVDHVLLDGGVRGEQLPWVRANGDAVSKKLRAEEVLFTFQKSEEALVDTINTTGRTRIEQVTHPAIKTNAPKSTSLESGHMIAKFFPLTNRVDTILAATNVVIQNGLRRGEGERAIYMGTNDTVELTGSPIAYGPDGTTRGAQTLFWQRERGRFGARGAFVSEWKRLPGSATNKSSLFSR